MYIINIFYLLKASMSAQVTSFHHTVITSFMVIVFYHVRYAFPLYTNHSPTRNKDSELLLII